jgi:hypothetical protein
MATRVGGIMAEIYLVGAMLLCALAVVSGSEQAPHAVRQIGVRTVAAILIGWLAAFALWPWLQAPNPFARFKAAYDFFSALRTDFQFRHWGREVSSQALPWDYIPSQFLARLSEAFVLLLVIAAGFGIAAAGGFFYKVATRKPGNGPSRFWAGARLIARYRARWIVTAAAFTPVAIAWLTHPTLFDGVRHFLFIVPPLALLAAWALLRMRPRILRYPLAAATIVGIHVGASVARMAALHPFEYTMINAFAAGPAGSSGRFDLDYWSLAATVAVRQLEARLDLDPSDRYRTRAPHVLVCIPWREDKAARLFRRPWIAETDPQQADFLIEPERGWCGQYSGRVVDQVERAGHVFARTIETNRGESEKRLEP